MCILVERFVFDPCVPGVRSACTRLATLPSAGAATMSREWTLSLLSVGVTG